MPPKTKTTATRPRGKKAGATAPSVAPAPPPAVSWWAARGCALAVFLIVFVIYLRTLLPTVVDQDSGELVSAAHVLGIPHPTGYPFWTLLARLFDLLPLGHTSAYRVGLLSAFAVALGAGLLTWTVARLSGVLLAGPAAGLSFAFWLPTWSQAVLAEVYGLEALIFTTFLLTLWWWDRRPTPRRLGWLAVSAGLAAMHHRTGSLAVLPALGAAFWVTHAAHVAGDPKQSPADAWTAMAGLARWRHLRVWAKAALCAAAPFVCYLYLPIRAVARPPMNWGNPDSWERFIAHASGRQYAPWAFMNDLPTALKEGRVLLGECLARPGWPTWVLLAVGLPLIAWGFACWVRRRPATAGSLAFGAIVLAVWVLFWGDMSDSKVWLIPVGAVLALFGGLGLARLAAGRPTFVACGLAAAAGLAMALLLLSANWTRADRSNVWGYRDAWAATMTYFAPRSLLITDSDAAQFIAGYMQQVEGRGKDVTVLSVPSFGEEWYLGLIGEKDRELRDAIETCWRQTRDEYDITHPGTEARWNGVARVAHLLAQRYRGRRAVYAPHPPTVPFPDPPYFVGLKDGLYRVDFSYPEVLRTAPARAPFAALPDGVQLVSLMASPTEAQAGTVVEFRSQWVATGPLPARLFALRLVPADPGRRSAWEGLLGKACFEQGYSLAYGPVGRPPSPPGTVYEQVCRYFVPSNAPAGDYRVELGYSERFHPVVYGHWVPLGDRVAVRVRPAPLPTNGP